MVGPSLKLASIAIGVGGVATGAGVGIYHGFIKSKEEEKKENAESTKDATPKVEETIAKSFETGTKKLLAKANTDTQWDTNWKTFKDAYDAKHSQNGVWKFENWATLKNENNAPSSFKERCEANSKTPKKNNEELLKQVEEYCTKAV